jgi:hypothetical protein
MKIRNGMLALMLITLTIPTITVAEENPAAEEQQKPGMDWMEKREERQKEILQIVEKYSPETLDEWKEAIATRNELLSKVDKDDWQRHHKHLGEKQWEKIKQKKQEEMRELKTAEESGNKEKVDELLNNMLTRLKEQNQKLQEKAL